MSDKDLVMREFGKDIWEWFKSNGFDLFEHEDSLGFMAIAEKHGLAKIEIFDPELHDRFNINCDLEKGDKFWIWCDTKGDSKDE